MFGRSAVQSLSFPVEKTLEEWEPEYIFPSGRKLRQIGELIHDEPLKDDHEFTDALGRPRECLHRDIWSLVGLTHPGKNGHDRIAMVRGLVKGTKLIIVPEPDNPLDRNALLVYRADDLEHDLGYIHASQAKRVCPLIERGTLYETEVYWINNRNPEYPEVYLYAFKMNEPVLAHRPVRRGAPHYR